MSALSATERMPTATVHDEIAVEYRWVVGDTLKGPWIRVHNRTYRTMRDAVDCIRELPSPGESPREFRILHRTVHTSTTPWREIAP